MVRAVDVAVNAPEHVIGRDVFLEAEIIEQTGHSLKAHQPHVRLERRVDVLDLAWRA